MNPIGIHGEKSYHLTTTKTPKGEMSYARIKFDDCIHHYILYDRENTSSRRKVNGRMSYGFMVEIYDLDGNFLANGDDMDFIPDENGFPATLSGSIQHAKGMVEYHLNDDYPLWTPSGWTTDPTPYGIE